MSLPEMSVALLGGMLLGALYFFLLWLTIEFLQSRRQPWLAAVLSFWTRLGTAAAGFYFLAAGRLENLAACLAGFMLVRLAAIHFARRKGISSPVR
jgi:F1F0 ATPase subunit 2